jgi:hypothetical protein
MFQVPLRITLMDQHLKQLQLFQSAMIRTQFQFPRRASEAGSPPAGVTNYRSSCTH